MPSWPCQLKGLPYRKESSALGWDTKGTGERALDIATLTAKGQVTVPKVVREALGLRQGDQLSWEVEDGSVRVRAIAPLDLAYLRSLDASLQEWSSPADEEAFAWCSSRCSRWMNA